MRGDEIRISTNSFCYSSRLGEAQPLVEAARNQEYSIHGTPIKEWSQCRHHCFRPLGPEGGLMAIVINVACCPSFANVIFCS
jgi:hypothetical protein